MFLLKWIWELSRCVKTLLLIYDEYRQLYYRMAYPKESLQEGESLSDMMQSGRIRFSIIILDKDLNVVGETMFPENLYGTNLYYKR